jgi:hypothetical protein
MGSRTSSKSAVDARRTKSAADVGKTKPRSRKDNAADPLHTESAAAIRFRATLLRPVSQPSKKPVAWTFLILPQGASARLPSRSMVSVVGTLNSAAFRATLEPDGQGSHWLKVDQKLQRAARLQVGDFAAVEITPLTPDQEPEPRVPPDLRAALASAPPKARSAWADITPIARRDWIHWIVSSKQAATRERRIRTACDMLANGKRRPCCFDRSGMYAKSMNCPVADTDGLTL